MITFCGTKTQHILNYIIFYFILNINKKIN
jgi:hypothetical protein